MEFEPSGSRPVTLNSRNGWGWLEWFFGIDFPALHVLKNKAPRQTPGGFLVTRVARLHFLPVFIPPVLYPLQRSAYAGVDRFVNPSDLAALVRGGFKQNGVLSGISCCAALVRILG